MKIFWCLSIFVYAATSWSAELIHDPTPYPAMAGLNGTISTWLSNTGPIEKKYSDQKKIYTLSDGTKIPTLFFASHLTTPHPLIIANFGLFSDERAPSVSVVIEKLVLTGKIAADFLMVDNVTSATFYSANHELGFGGYDEGRILVELATEIRGAPGFSNSSVELLGVSLGGNAVLQALVEDRRLGRRDFDSAVVFSAVINELESSSALLRAFGHPDNDLPNVAMRRTGKLIVDFSLNHFKSQLGDTANMPVHESDVGNFYYSQFSDRLRRLKTHASELLNWNPEISLETAADYIRSSSSTLQNIGSVEIPVVVVHALDDPLVPYQQFEKFQELERSNPRVLTYGTRFGGHWGFTATYGADWVLDLINRARSEAKN